MWCPGSVVDLTAVYHSISCLASTNDRQNIRPESRKKGGNKRNGKPKDGKQRENVKKERTQDPNKRDSARKAKQQQGQQSRQDTFSKHRNIPQQKQEKKPPQKKNQQQKKSQPQTRRPSEKKTGIKRTNPLTTETKKKGILWRAVQKKLNPKEIRITVPNVIPKKSTAISRLKELRSRGIGSKRISTNPLQTPRGIGKRRLAGQSTLSQRARQPVMIQREPQRLPRAQGQRLARGQAQRVQRVQRVQPQQYAGVSDDFVSAQIIRQPRNLSTGASRNLAPSLMPRHVPVYNQPAPVYYEAVPQYVLPPEPRVRVFQEPRPRVFQEPQTRAVYDGIRGGNAGSFYSDDRAYRERETSYPATERIVTPAPPRGQQGQRTGGEWYDYTSLGADSGPKLKQLFRGANRDFD
ncbi:hypothetical protein PROFUN_12777 [Planoprotostelium fungivorum]|uniref:Uncharacterized protein n=1 Tax=Planoprotostelium fungivorum TaxID=1890364 RepID=A0A2P6N6G3_9EUKA|nr:hypothetical protein PROFUN_12777 [Planoprotostelium fungivorum]